MTTDKTHVQTDLIQTNPLNDQLIRWPELHQLIGMSRNSVHTLIRAGKFPSQIKIVEGGRASAWILSEVQAYLEARIAERDAQGGNNNADS